MRRITENGTSVLLADEGMLLTNGDSYVSTVRLGKEDYGVTWYEVPKAQYEEKLKAEEETSHGV